MSKDLNVTILGAGSWGTTLAILLNRKGYKVSLWEAFPDYAETLIETRINEKYLPGIRLDENIRISPEIKSVAESANIVVVAVPTQYVRAVFEKLVKEFPHLTCPFVSVAKGLEVKTLKRVSEIISDFYPKNDFVVLSGPSHAEEVSRGIPTSVVAASVNNQKAEFVQRLFMDENFRVYTNSDVTGVELGGALKNIIAIACGISDGLGFGDNSRAALMTRGLAEIIRFASAMGAKARTFSGLAGVGDLIATCSSEYSRNRRVGCSVGQGKALDDVLRHMNMVAEGVETTRSVVDLSDKLAVDMPIAKQVYEVLFNKKDPRKAVRELMGRGPKEE